MMNARECALHILYKIETRSAFSNVALDEAIAKGALETLDRGFCTQLVYGCLRHRNTLDHVIRGFLETPERFRQMNRWLLCILRMGVLQILYLDKVPFYSAVDEAVKLAKQYGPPGSAKFINAVLRNVCEHSARVTDFDAMGEVEGLALKFSHPEWFVKRLIARHGKSEASRILKANNHAPTFTLRVNTLKATPESLLAALADLSPERTRICPEGITVRRAAEVTELASFADGHFYIQDESSMIVAHAVDPQPLEVIFDLCAAPGGKTTHMAALANNEALVVAYDRFSHKMNRIKENCRRLGVTGVTLKLQDVLRMREDRRAHRVLADVPCSCTGIIRHHPELKWQLTEPAVAELAKIQRGILEAGAHHVAPGGVLVYSACSIEEEETVDVVRGFLAARPEFSADPFPERLLGWLDAAVPDHEGREGRLRLFPHRHGTDGFFVARMRRRP